MQGTYLSGVDLTEAILDGAQLQGSTLDLADLQAASLIGVGLQGAALWNTNLQRAVLWEADVRGADLSGALLDYAILSTRAGPLGEADLRLMTETDAFGEWYGIARADYQTGVEIRRATSWPPGSGALPCLFISPESLIPPGLEASESDAAGPPPNCGYNYDSGDDALTLFWRGFAEVERGGLCDEIEAGAGDPLQVMPLLRYALDTISYAASGVVAERMGKMIATSLKDELAGPACATLWPEQSLKDAITRMQKSARGRPIAAEVAFHSAWIEAIKNAPAKAAKPEANTPPQQQK
jgi:hypothetical protein